MRKKKRSLSLVLTLLMLLSAFSLTSPVFAAPSATDPQDAALAFDPDKDYQTLNVTVDGKSMTVRSYRLVYVANPVPVSVSGQANYQYETMNLYIPDNATAASAIILQVGNSGWMPSTAGTSVTNNGTYNGTTNKVGQALKNGYVIANIGTRSRGLVDTSGNYVGHSPAVVVDTKAAIRWLRLNDKVMPGSAERIAITGTSGGGGLSVAVAASGNSPDYYPYLKEIGAAGIDDEHGVSTLRDDVFATIAYCPINDLDHADLAYAFTYNQVMHDAPQIITGYTAGTQTPWSMPIYQDKDEALAKMLDTADEFVADYESYLAALALKDAAGNVIDGARMRELIQEEVSVEIARQVAAGVTMPAIGENFTGTSRVNTWLNSITDNGDGSYDIDMDLDAFLLFVASGQALKIAPAFDNVGTSLAGTQNETNLGGPKNLAYQNFSEWPWNNNIVSGDGSGADDTGLSWADYTQTAAGKTLALQAKMISPIPYLTSATDGDSAPYWYVRHGMVDRDTSFATQVQLEYAIKNDPTIKESSFKLRYLQGHSGDYDIEEAYTWLAGVAAKADAELPVSALTGLAKTTAGSTIDYTIYLGNVSKANTATVNFDYTDNLELVDVSAAGGFSVLKDSAKQATLQAVNFAGGVSFTDAQAILKLSFKAKTEGDASVTLKGVFGGVITNGTTIDYTALIDKERTKVDTVVSSWYDPFDFNRDHRVTPADLSYALMFFGYYEGCTGWDTVSERGIDVNGDGRVDTTDFIIILAELQSRGVI